MNGCLVTILDCYCISDHLHMSPGVCYLCAKFEKKIPLHMSKKWFVMDTSMDRQQGYIPVLVAPISSEGTYCINSKAHDNLFSPWVSEA